jgi:sugar phosphate isomerase/epimerase
MQLGIFAKTFPRATLEETLDTIAYQKLSCIQFNMSCVGLPTLPERIDEDLCRWIARSLRDRGLTMAAISGTFNLCDPDASRLGENLRRLGVLAAACRWLDTRIITLCTGTLNPDDMWKHHPDNVRRGTWETLVKSVREAVQIADGHEVTLAFEPEIHNVVSSVMRARKLLDEIGSPWLKVVIDPTNLFSQGEVRPLSALLCEVFDWLGKDIVLAHAKPPHFAELPGTTAWLSDFLGARYHDARQAARRFLERAAGRKEMEQFVQSWEERTRLTSFFQPYAIALREASYTGPVVIHGTDEGDLQELATLLRAVLKISDGPEPGK